MKGLETNIDLIAEFISPLEEPLRVLFIGDNMNTEMKDGLKNSINSIRNTFDLELNASDLSYPEFIDVSTSELFRGQAQDLVNDVPCIMITDREMTSGVMNILAMSESDNDPLDNMLINKYLLELGHDAKYIMDVTDVDDETLELLFMDWDQRNGEINYYMAGNYLGIWFYDNQPNSGE